MNKLTKKCTFTPLNCMGSNDPVTGGSRYVLYIVIKSKYSKGQSHRASPKFCAPLWKSKYFQKWAKENERIESQNRWKCVMRMFNCHNDVYFGPMRVERQEEEMGIDTIFPFQKWHFFKKIGPKSLPRRSNVGFHCAQASTMLTPICTIVLCYFRQYYRGIYY